MVGPGRYRKHAYYLPTEAKEVRNERRRFEKMDLQAAVDNEVKATVPGLVQDEVANTLNAIMPTLVQSLKCYLEGDQIGRAHV